MKKFLLAVGCAAGLVAWAHGQEIRGGSDALRLVFDGPLVDLTLGPCDPIPAPLTAKAVGGCADPSVAKDLVLYYPFDEDLGQIVQDASGNGRTGQVNGTTWVKDGARGGAMRFDSNKQSITATDAGLPSGNSPRTMAVWIKLDKLYPDGTTGLFSYGTWQWNRACGLGMDWRLDRDQFYFTQNGGVALSQAKMEQAGVWRHLAYVYDGSGRHQLFVDGESSPGMSELRGPLNTTPSGLLMLAGHPGSIGPDGGWLDEAMIFDRALSPAEVAAVYRGALPVETLESAEGDCPRVITRVWATREMHGSQPYPGAIPVEMKETSAGDCPRVITRVWSATDRCGNTAGATQTITVVDTTPPELVGVPANAALKCGSEIPRPPEVTARDADGCGTEAPGGMALRFEFESRQQGKEARGGVVFDSSGNGNHGVVKGARIGRDGVDGKAAHFDGVDDYIRVPSSPSLIPEAVTVSAWVKVHSRPRDIAVIVHKRNTSLHNNEDYVLQLTAAGAARFVLANSGRQTRLDSAPLSLGKWHHVAATFARPAMAIYVDGQLAGTATHDYPLAHNPKADLFLAASDHLENPMASFAHISLDDVRIYPRALNSAEVGAMLRGTLPVEFTETTTGDCPGTITRVWSATDRCGNTASATQTIALLPPTTLILVGVPEDMELACGETVPPPPVVTALAAPGCEAAPLPGLILHYPFDEDLGGTVLDASGGGRTGQVNGATWVPDGAHGGAYRFASTLETITAPDAGLPAGDAPRTIAAWMKIEQTYPERVTWMLSYGTSRFNQQAILGYDWRQGRDCFFFSQYGACFLSAAPAGDLGTWVHVAYTYGGQGRHHLYVNGQPSDGMNELQGALNTVLSGVLRLGAPPVSAGPDGGYLDEVMIFNRELTPAEVATLPQGAAPVQMTETVSGDCPGTITRVWTATDGCGNTASATQVITRVSTAAPVLVGVPQDMEIACGAPVPPPPVVTALAAPGCEAAPLPGLILHYPFDEDLGGTVLDASGGGRTGLVDGATWVPDGAHGGAFRFNSNQQCITATDAGLPAGDAPRTIAAWVRLDTAMPDTSTGLIFYGKRYFFNQESGVGVDGRQDRDRFFFSQGGACFLSQRKVGDVGQWVQVAYTYGGAGRHHLYVNGEASDGANELSSGLNTVLDGILRVGGQPWDTGLAGISVDEVMIFDRELSPAEVVALQPGGAAVQMRETTAGECPGTITRVWTATDRCGNSASATQTITVAGQGATGDWYVASDGNDAADGTSWATAKQTIQAAVDLARAGDTVWVSNGVYETGTRVTPGHLLHNRVVITNDITVRSVNGPVTTVIRGQGPRGSNAVRCVYMAAGRLMGFTLANGHTRTDGGTSHYDENGGGLSVDTAGSGWVSNCLFMGNSAYNSGGGTYGTYYNCVFRSNSAERAGGAVSPGTLYNCFMERNSAVQYGGAIDQGAVYNCTIAGNSAANGGGVYNCRLYNCIVYSNTPANVAVATCRYTCTTPAQSGTGNIADNPRLLAGGHIALDSPCAGRGASDYAFGTDLDGEVWMIPPSMGCDEPYPSVPLRMAAKSGVSGTGSLTVSSSTDRVYTLQRCADLVAGIWLDVPGQVRIRGTGGELTLADPESLTACYYRVVSSAP